MLFANITDMTVNMRFNLNGNIGAGECSYSLGDELFNFLSFDIADVYALYIQMGDAFMEYHYDAKNEKAYKEKLTALCDELDRHSVYLHLYTMDFLNSMAEVQQGWKYSMESFVAGKTLTLQDMLFRTPLLMEDNSLKPYFEIDFLETYPFDMSKVDMLATPTYAERQLARQKARSEKAKPLSKASMQKPIGLAVLFIAEDLKRKRAMFLGDIEAITGGDKSLDGFSLSQKLYLLDVRRETNHDNPIYNAGALWQTSYATYPKIPIDMTDEKKVRAFIQKNKVEIKQVHEITSVEGLIVFELLSLLDRDAAIKKCRYCGNYFVPQGRSDAVFCERVAKGETKPCRLIGSLKLHKAAKADNPIHEAHTRAYRRMNSKCRTKRITQSEFFAWSEEARAKRDACLAGKLPFAEFAAWLDEDKRK